MSDTKDIVINLDDSNEDLLMFKDEVETDISNNIREIFTVLKPEDDFNELFSSSEDVIVEEIYPSIHSENIFTTAYNTVVDLISPLTNYVYDFFWGK